MIENKTCMHCGQTISPEDAEYLGHVCNDCEWAAHMDFEVAMREIHNALSGNKESNFHIGHDHGTNGDMTAICGWTIKEGYKHRVTKTSDHEYLAEWMLTAVPLETINISSIDVEKIEEAFKKYDGHIFRPHEYDLALWVEAKRKLKLDVDNLAETKKAEYKVLTWFEEYKKSPDRRNLGFGKWVSNQYGIEYGEPYNANSKDAFDALVKGLIGANQHV